MEQRDFFISYTKTDKDWAVWIAETLKKHGYSVCTQALDIYPGDDFLEKMEEFVENSANFIAVWSKDYSESDYCMQEFRAAFAACHQKRMGCLLPVRVEKYPLKRLYSSLVHADLFGKNGNAADSEVERTLLDAVRYVTSRSEAEPNEAKPECPKISPPQPPKRPLQVRSWRYVIAVFGLIALLLIGNANWYRLSEIREARYLYQTAESYYYGKNGEEQDYAKALEYYEKAFDAGYTRAAVRAAEVRRKLNG